MLCSVLDNEQIEKIHETSLAILERVGVELPHDETLSRFADAGAKVDFAAKSVSIPPELVMRLLAGAAKTFTLHGRDTNRIARFGQNARNYNSSSGQALWIESPGKHRRYPTLEDVAAAARLADALEQINITGAMADPHEVPVGWRCVAVLAEMIRSTTKPVTFWFHDRRSAAFIVEALVALRGSEKKAAELPYCYPLLEPISPLRFGFNGIDLLYETARLNMPVAVGPMAQMGMSAPATVAGTMAQENAEILAGICVTQLIRPGTGVCYGGICHSFDMAKTQVIFAGPEQAIFGVAMTQMGKHYELPVYINSGLTDSKCVDAQAGLEVAATLSLGMAAGADIFGHMGICGADQGASLEMLVMQSEVISYLESVMREIDFSNEALGLEALAEVGIGGNFLASPHTAEHFRKEMWFPHLLDRDFYQAWMENNATSMYERCRRLKEEILSSHEVQPISAELGKALDEIVAAAGKELT
ncbi:MAG: trimethylamine methyltransferase family protein [Planctomycetota bacterium]|jgi:trimethylamine--corrinoid protein Co-methyltransferase